MIIVELVGGLGNQLFQYAIGRSLAEARQTTMKLDKSPFATYKLHAYSLNHFSVDAMPASASEVARFHGPGLGNRLRRLPARLTGNPYRIVTERLQFTYDPSLLPESRNLYLRGYWQTEEYFRHVEPMLRAELTIRTPPDRENAALAADIAQANAVCIHVRRGDYVANAQTNSVHGACSLDYYRAAIKRMTETVTDPKFFVFSDDPDWTRANLQFDHLATFVSHNAADRNYEDLRLMSLCKHFIIANSTFSWWGAWLSGNETKTVIAPMKWLQSTDLANADLIPSSWIRL
ncbi:alpha-1,2-fucosyltransferase [soil metagenome]